MKRFLAVALLALALVSTSATPALALYTVPHKRQCMNFGCVTARRVCTIHNHCSMNWGAQITHPVARHCRTVALMWTLKVNGALVQKWTPYAHDEPGDYPFHGTWGRPTVKHARGWYHHHIWGVGHMGPNDTLVLTVEGVAWGCPDGDTYWLWGRGTWKGRDS